jgi:hypothetical protein
MSDGQLFATDDDTNARALGAGDVLAAGGWRNNAELIRDVARLGYLDGHVLDVTYGEGSFWTLWQPEHLTTNDRYKPADHAWDYRALPVGDASFDSTVFDPPYKLNGTPTNDGMDDRYGTGGPKYTPTGDRMADMLDGARECLRVCRRYLLVKCQDMVASGHVVWQTDHITRAVEDAGGRKVDLFELVVTPRPQQGRQVHSRRNLSTLLVFSPDAS